MKLRNRANGCIDTGLVMLCQDQLELVVGGNARDTVTGSFSEKEEIVCYDSGFTWRGTPVRLCLELYH